MISEHLTTPFGRRTLTLASVAAQVAARDVEGKAAHKWRTFSAIAESKEALGVSDRTLAVLNALLTFIPETALSPGQLVVFASNKALALRAHGMAESTLRRHLNALVRANLVIRRDSPNGKRYARKDDNGDVEAAFGFDLTPLVARAGEFEALAAKVVAARRAAAMARERVTILRRDIGKMIQAGLVLGVPADWGSLQEAYLRLSRRLPRFVAPEIIAPLLEQLSSLAMIVSKALESTLETENMSGNVIRDDVQLQSSKTDILIDLEPRNREKQGGGAPPRPLPLGVVLKACPDIALYDRNQVRTWNDLLGTVALVRGMLGISASAWQEAREVMGDRVAAATVAGILQRAEGIKSPGGYLRDLTEKAKRGQFTVWPMMLASLRSNQPVMTAPQQGRYPTVPHPDPN